MRKYVKRRVSQCLECLFHKAPAGKKPRVLHPIVPANRPFEVLHLNHLGPFTLNTSCNQEILVIVDSFTKYLRLFAVCNTSTNAVLEILDKYTSDYDVPKRIISDRGTAFTSAQFEAYCKEKGIIYTKTFTQWPQGNGLSRKNKSHINSPHCHVNQAPRSQRLGQRSRRNPAKLEQHS